MTRCSARHLGAEASLCALALFSMACSAAPPPTPEPGRREGWARQPVEVTRVDVESLPSIALTIDAEPSTPDTAARAWGPALVTVRSTFLPGAPKGHRRVEVVNDAPLGLVSMGGRTVWRGDPRQHERPMTAMCGPEPGAAPPARWLTLRSARRRPGSLEVRVGEGNFDGRRCALVAASGGTAVAPTLEPTVPVHGFVACQPPCNREEPRWLIVLMPSVARIVVDTEEAASIEQGAFTVLRLPLAPATSQAVVARVTAEDATAFREALGLVRGDPDRDFDVAIEATRGDREPAPTVTVSVARAVAPLRGGPSP